MIKRPCGRRTSLVIAVAFLTSLAKAGLAADEAT
jgi:hypothetical protein